jgi:hypothetical protein
VGIESKLQGFERDAERGEKLREEIGKKLGLLNRDLMRDISEMVRVMFRSDKEFERALKQRLDAAATSKKEFILTQSGQKFKVSDIDPKRVIAQRELTGFEEEKLKKIKETIGEVETAAKAAIGAVRRERVLLNEFSKDARSIASDLRRELRDSDDKSKLESQINDFESKAGRISSAESDLEGMQREALKVMQTAKSAQSVISGVSSRTDLEEILVGAAGGFGITAAVAALVGSMGAAGILAMPALIAFALSRIVKLVKDVAGDD